MSQGRFSSSMVSAPAVTCMKILMMIFNFIFWVTGIAILAVGIWAKVQLYIYMELASLYKEAPFILIGVGAVIVLVGSLGCCCTVKGHSRLLYLYAFFLIIVFVVELGAGIAGFIKKKDLQSGFNEGLRNGTKYDYGQKGHDKRTEAIDELQHQLECCGVANYTDWFTTEWEKEQKIKKSVPKSCCRGDQTKCLNTDLPLIPTNQTKQEIFTEGCYNKVVDFMDSNMGIIGGVALGISFFQLLGAMLACFLAKHINKAKYEQVA